MYTHFCEYFYKKIKYKLCILVSKKYSCAFENPLNMHMFLLKNHDFLGTTDTFYELNLFESCKFVLINHIYQTVGESAISRLARGGS